MFEQVTGIRMAYGAPAVSNLCPADAVLSQSAEKRSHGPGRRGRYRAVLRRPAPVAADLLLVMQFDGTGIDIIPTALRAGAVKAARRAGGSFPPTVARGAQERVRFSALP